MLETLLFSSKPKLDVSHSTNLHHAVRFNIVSFAIGPNLNNGIKLDMVPFITGPNLNSAVRLDLVSFNKA